MALLIKKPAEYNDSRPLYETGLTDDLIIVGLGNPGTKYQYQRHNLGWQCLEGWAERHQLDWQTKTGLQSQLATAHLNNRRVRLVKPQTYVNRTGPAVVAVSQYFKVPPEQIWVVYDEIQLPWGRVGITRDDPLGSHNGLASIATSCSGVPPLPRIQIGIGPQPKGIDRTDFVLGELTGAEQTDLPAILNTVVELITEAVAGQLQPGRHQVCRPAANNH